MTSDAITVAELLHLHLAHEPAAYVLGSEPAPPPTPRTPRRRASPLERSKVVPFLEAVRAGVPDRDVSRAAGVTVAQVRGWRLRLGIRRKRGTSTMARLHGAMLDTPTLAQALRELYRRDDAPPPDRDRVSYEELREYLAKQGMSLKLRDSDFRERSAIPHRRPA